MSLKTAVDNIGAWAVTGVTTNYGMQAPASLTDTKLPALVVELAGGRQPGLATVPLDVNLAGGRAQVVLNHLLVYRSASLDRPETMTYGTLALVDNYLAKVKADWTLSAALLEPLAILDIQLVGYSRFVAVKFIHKWVLKV